MELSLPFPLLDCPQNEKMKSLTLFLKVSSDILDFGFAMDNPACYRGE